MTLNSPLDLVKVFIVDVAGTPEIFSFVALVFVGMIMGKMNFNNTEALIFFALFGVIMSSYLTGLYVMINLIVGLIIYYQIAKVAK